MGIKVVTRRMLRPFYVRRTELFLCYGKYRVSYRAECPSGEDATKKGDLL